MVGWALKCPSLHKNPPARWAAPVDRVGSAVQPNRIKPPHTGLNWFSQPISASRRCLLAGPAVLGTV